MKLVKISFLFSAFAFLLILPLFAESGSKTVFKAGMTVAAKWTDGAYYLAKIASVKDGVYSVDFADGDKGSVKAEDMLEIPAKISLKKGDKVMAVWSSAKFYTGVVDDVTKEGAVIKWDDGSSPSDVSYGKIIKLTPPAEFKVGMTVAAKSLNGSYYLAVIKSVKNGVYTVKYEGGSEGEVTVDDLLEIPDKPDLNIGDKVLAVMSGGKFCPGIVKEFTEIGPRIQWDDGSDPMPVEWGKVIKR